MTLIVLIGTATLGLVMTVYLVSLAMRRRYVVACCLLALAFALISVSAALLAVHLAYGFPTLVPIRALLALVAVACLYLYFVAAGSDRYALSVRHGIHALPFGIGLFVVTANLSWLLDFVLLVSYLVYAAALVVLWKGRAKHFAGLGDNAHKTVIWLQTVILFLVTTLILDAFIAIDLAGGGFLQTSGPLLLSIVSLVALVAFSLMGALGRPSFFEHLYNLSVEAGFGSGPQNDVVPDAAQWNLAEKALLSLMDPDVLADEALTITRLARRLRVPARQLSQAINRVHKSSFSDLLNDQRIRLCEQIMHEDSDRSLIDIMLDAGYVTKSNFYRQFSKRTGLTPAAYRANLKQEARSRSAESVNPQSGRTL